MTGSASDDKEIAAIATINSALTALDDIEARRRVLSYVLARHLPDASASALRAVTTQTFHPQPRPATPDVQPDRGSRELAGVARLDDAGNVRITVRDLK